MFSNPNVDLKFNVRRSLKPIMGNVGSDSFNDKIRLTDGERIKLENWIQDLDGEEKSSLHYVVLEGDCVLITITRYFDFFSKGPLWNMLDTKPWDKLDFSVRKYFVCANEMKYFQTYSISFKKCLENLNRYVSPNGALALEDHTHQALDIFMTAFDLKTCFLNRYWIPAGGVFVSLNKPVPELRSAMVNMLNRDTRLQSLTKRVILSHCVELDNLPLPKQMVNYLKE